MFNPFSKYNVIKNFPRNYPLHRKVKDNITFLLSCAIVHSRKNLLSQQDLKRVKRVLKKGDVVLLGNLKTVLSTIIDEPVTHSCLYVGKNKFIHSIAAGVQYMSIYHVFTEYDTLVILRIPKVKHRRSIIKKLVRYVKTQFGKPYDFDFVKGPTAFFCTELVNEGLKHAGYKSGLKTFKRPKKGVKKIESLLSDGAADVLHPNSFLKGRFDLVFLSHNLRLEDKKLTFIKK